MRPRGSVKLDVVRNEPRPAGKRKLSPEEEAERQRRREHWARVHIASDRSPPISLCDRARRIFTRGGGIRRERGGFKFEERA